MGLGGGLGGRGGEGGLTKFCRDGEGVGVLGDDMFELGLVFGGDRLVFGVG